MSTAIDALKLFHSGSSALSRATQNGFKIDVEYFKGIQPEIKEQTREIEKDLIQNTEIGRAWFSRYGSTLNLESTNQFKTVLEQDMQFTDFKISAKGNKSVDVDVIGRLPSEFAGRFLRYKQLEKAYSTYVSPVLREVDSQGFVHANFPLARVKTYRGSCDSPNLQNQPKRNKLLRGLIRRGFIPRASNRVLVEMDLKGAECAIGACIHRDPAMIAYVTNDSLDMHRDGAMKVFLMDKELVSKDIRSACKGDFTFAEFYGATYNTVAPRLWESVLDEDLKTTTGISVLKHLYDHGIKDLDSFTAHIRQVEKHFWGTMFKGYSAWKNETWETYMEQGYMQSTTGFYFTQESNKEQILNAPIQGPSFHFLLKMLIKMMQKMIRSRMSSLIIAQIHDAIVLDAVASELDDICNLFWSCQDEIVKEWPWLVVPIRAEVEACSPGCSWADMNAIGFVKRS